MVGLWLSTAISLSIICWVLVLVMAKWWPSKAATAVDIGGGKSHEERLEMQVNELETAGDLDGAAALLLAAWTKKGSTRAVTLAHELSQRHPAQAFQMGCPLQQGNRVSELAPTRREQEEEHDAAGAAADGCGSGPTPGVSTSEAVAPNTGIGAAPERASDEIDERELPPAAITRESRSSGGGDAIAIIAEATTPSSSGNGNDANDERNCGGGDGETPSPPTPTTNSTVTTPWERGWQGPEGFKPPPPQSSSSNSSSSGTAAAANPTPSSESGSTSLSSLSPKRKAEEGDSGGKQAVIPRNFTVSQLNAFDGGVPAPIVRGGVIKAKEARPIYIALRGVVYDASAGRNLYGPVSNGGLRFAIRWLGVCVILLAACAWWFARSVRSLDY